MRVEANSAETLSWNPDELLLPVDIFTYTTQEILSLFYNPVYVSFLINCSAQRTLSPCYVQSFQVGAYRPTQLPLKAAVPKYGSCFIDSAVSLLIDMDITPCFLPLYPTWQTRRGSDLPPV